MRKADLINKVALSTGTDKQLTERIIETTLKTITNFIVSGEPLYIRNFGTFNIVKKKAKIGRNISKGTSLNIPSHNSPKFIFSKKVKDKVKENVKCIE